MVSFTAGSSTDSLAGDGTYSGAVVSPGFTETVGGLDADGFASPSTWSGPQSWTPLNVLPSGLVGPATYSGVVVSPGFTETVAGLDAAATAGPSTWSGTQMWEPLSPLSSGLVGPATYSGAVVSPGFTETVGGLSAEASAGTGAFIPSAYFRRVTVEVVNPSGEPITQALWLVSQNGLPTAAKVENAEAEIQLLRQEMDDFTLIVESGEEGVDFVWYEEVTDDRSIPSNDAKAQLVFDPEEPAGGGGTYAVGGASFG